MYNMFIKTLSAIEYEWPTNLQWEPKAGLLSQDVMQSFHNKFYYERGFSCWAKNRTHYEQSLDMFPHSAWESETFRSQVMSIKTLGKHWLWESTSDLSITRIIYCTIQYKKVHGKWVICQNWNWFMTLAFYNVLKIESTGHVLTCPCQGFPINTGSALGTDQTPFRLAFGHFESELDLVSQAF